MEEAKKVLHDYPSDITREEFALIEDIFDNAKKKTRPRDVDLYDVFCAILYLVKDGIPWRMMPANFPKWQLVYYYFSLWKKANANGVTCFNKALERIRTMFRNDDLRKDKTTFVIGDSKTISNADTAKEAGYDAGKKRKCVKLHMLVDSRGLPHGMLVTTADVSDRAGALELIARNKGTLSEVEAALFDGAYTGENFANAVKSILSNMKVQVAKRSELHKFAVMPMRWVVERTFGWIDKARRLWKNCERFLHTTQQISTIALLAVMIKRF